MTGKWLVTSEKQGATVRSDASIPAWCVTVPLLSSHIDTHASCAPLHEFQTTLFAPSSFSADNKNIPS